MTIPRWGVWTSWAWQRPGSGCRTTSTWVNCAPRTAPWSAPPAHQDFPFTKLSWDSLRWLRLDLTLSDCFLTPRPPRSAPVCSDEFLSTIIQLDSDLDWYSRWPSILSLYLWVIILKRIFSFCSTQCRGVSGTSGCLTNLCLWKDALNTLSKIASIIFGMFTKVKTIFTRPDQVMIIHASISSCLDYCTLLFTCLSRVL